MDLNGQINEKYIKYTTVKYKKMAFRRRPTWRKKAPRRRPARRVMKRRVASNIYSFKRTVNLGTMSCINNAGVLTNLTNAYQFKLSDLPVSSEFTTLYDQYCIKGIKLSAVCTFSESANLASSGNNTTQTQGFQRLMSVLDYDDVVPITSEGTALQYQNLKITGPNKMHSRYFKPAVSQEINEGLTSPAIAVKKNVWLDCNYPNVPHFGVKFYQSAPYAATGASANMTWTLYGTYYLQFKNVR